MAPTPHPRAATPAVGSERHVAGTRGLHAMALGDSGTRPIFAPRRATAPARSKYSEHVEPSRLLTVLVTASVSPLNPSTAILRELILSLTHLQLPQGNLVLLSHDGPRLKRDAHAHNASAPYSWPLLAKSMAAQEFPSKYLQYLGDVQRLIPEFEACTHLTIRLLQRATNGHLAGNLAFALAYVRTPYMLKVEHDHLFTRPFNLLSVVRDMIADPQLKYVRFNRRNNIRVRCDNGDYYRSSPPDQLLGQALWGAHMPRGGVRLANNYTRTCCFSDMNHLTSTDYYRTWVLPVILRPDWGYPTVTPENLMQDYCWIARNHSTYGTYIFDAIDAPPTIAHVDAALHGVGELLPQVRVWARDVRARARNGTADGPFRCSAPLDLRPPDGLDVAQTVHRLRHERSPQAQRAPQGAKLPMRHAPRAREPRRIP